MCTCKSTLFLFNYGCACSDEKLALTLTDVKYRSKFKCTYKRLTYDFEQSSVMGNFFSKSILPVVTVHWEVKKKTQGRRVSIVPIDYDFLQYTGFLRQFHGFKSPICCRRPVTRSIIICFLRFHRQNTVHFLRSRYTKSYPRGRLRFGDMCTFSEFLEKITKIAWPEAKRTDNVTLYTHVVQYITLLHARRGERAGTMRRK